MDNKTLISVRSNCSFSLNYETSNLHPKAEIILITTQPKYKLNNKKDKFIRESEVTEYRFLADAQSINALIGELQLVVTSINGFEQMAAGLNGVIEANKPK